MNDWFRLWHGAPTDPKWRTVAKRAGVRPGDVWAVVTCLYDRASQAKDRGSFAGYDAEVIGDALGFEAEDVERIVQALAEKGVVAADRIVSWEKYQPIREDGSAARAKAWRDKQKAGPNAGIANGTETNATERDRTQANSREDAETEEIEVEGERAQPAPALTPAASPEPRQVDPAVIRVRTELVAAFNKAGTLPPPMYDVEVWLGRGYDPDMVIEVCSAGIRRGVSSLNYFARQLEREHARLKAERERPPPMIEATPNVVTVHPPQRQQRHGKPNVLDILSQAADFAGERRDAGGDGGEVLQPIARLPH